MDNQLLTTQQVCEALGVSRFWVNTHLRALGQAGWENADRRWIFYRESDILAYINRHAVVMRQTETLDLADYIPVDELDRKIQEIDRIPDIFAAAEAKAAFIRSIIPEKYKPIYDAETLCRQRGQFRWYHTATRINALHHLVSMEELREQQDGRSAEMIYRENFLLGRPKVMLHGRVWFLCNNLIEKRPLLVCLRNEG